MIIEKTNADYETALELRDTLIDDLTNHIYALECGTQPDMALLLDRVIKERNQLERIVIHSNEHIRNLLRRCKKV